MSETSDGDLRPGLDDDSTPAGGADVRLTVWLSGQVQGVGMRWWIKARSLELGLAGSASNREDGRVEVVAEGSRSGAAALLALLDPAADVAGRPGRITATVEQWAEPRGGLAGFRER
jgi:acylphosphatase